MTQAVRSQVSGAGPQGLALAMRVGSVMLGAGAPTDDIERTMRRVGLAMGLLEVQAVVTMGILTMSAVTSDDPRPMTQTRFISARTTDFARIIAIAGLVDEIDAERLSPVLAAQRLDVIERQGPVHPAWLLAGAMGMAAAAATVLFGGTWADALVTFVIGALLDPVVRRIGRSELPDFFQALFGPLIATLAATVVVWVGLPVDGGFLVAGAILRFLPGSALVSGMRDLIDRAPITGTARIAEALLLGAGVAGGTAAAIRIGEAIGAPTLTIGLYTTSTLSVPIQALAAAVACAAFGLSLGVAGPRLAIIAMLGAVAWLAELAVTTNNDIFLPVIAAAVVVGVAGQALSRRQRIPSVVWTVPAIFTLLPGLTMVRGILDLGEVAGVLTVLAALGVGCALGAGVALGSILVTVARQATLAAQTVVMPVLVDVQSGLRPPRRPQRSRPASTERSERPE